MLPFSKSQICTGCNMRDLYRGWKKIIPCNMLFFYTEGLIDYHNALQYHMNLKTLICVLRCHQSYITVPMNELCKKETSKMQCNLPITTRKCDLLIR